MMLHNLLAAHQADPDRNRWDNGLFVSACQICGRAMVKPPGEKWQLVSKAKGR